MEGLVVGGLTALTAIIGAVYWQLLVRPERLLGAGLGVSWEEHPTGVGALRWALAGLLFVLSVLTGLAMVLLSTTQGAS